MAIYFRKSEQRNLIAFLLCASMWYSSPSLSLSSSFQSIVCMRFLFRSSLKSQTKEAATFCDAFYSNFGWYFISSFSFSPKQTYGATEFKHEIKRPIVKMHLLIIRCRSKCSFSVFSYPSHVRMSLSFYLSLSLSLCLFSLIHTHDRHRQRIAMCFCASHAVELPILLGCDII